MRKSFVSFILVFIMTITLAFSFSQTACAAGKVIREPEKKTETETVVEVEETSADGTVVMIADEEVPLAIYDDPLTDGIYIPIIAVLCGLVMVMGGAILVFTRNDEFAGR